MGTTDLGRYDCVVLGAGISGLVSASVLIRDGARSVLVIDEYPHVGGNHIDKTFGPYTYDIGSLIFQDDSPLLDHFPELLPHYVPIDPTWGRINPQGHVTEYPFSVKDDVLAAGPVELVRIACSAAQARLSRRPLSSAKDFADHWLGPRFVHRSGLDHYMERFCGLPPEQIDLKFAEKRMGWIPVNASVKNVVYRLLKCPDGPPPTNHQLARPVSGFQELYAPAVQRLSETGVDFRLGGRALGVTRSHGSFTVRLADGTVSSERLVSTIPIDDALRACGTPPGEPLPTVRLISLFCSFSGDRGFDQSVLYNFSGAGAWKRLTVYSDFYGRRDGREYFGVEVIADRRIGDIDAASTDFREHTQSCGVLQGDLRIEGSNILDNAYPIYTRGSADRAQRGVDALRSMGVESLGRQGAFEYQPTARSSALEAEAALRDRPTSPDAAVER